MGANQSTESEKNKHKSIKIIQDNISKLSGIVNDTTGKSDKINNIEPADKYIQK